MVLWGFLQAGKKALLQGIRGQKRVKKVQLRTFDYMIDDKKPFSHIGFSPYGCPKGL
jgi:hypothetical protein